MKKAVTFILFLLMCGNVGYTEPPEQVEQHATLSVTPVKPPIITAKVKAAEKATIKEPIIPEYRYIKECPFNKELQQEIYDICKDYGISFEFVMAVIKQESNFDIYATGDRGRSKGLMQIQERWWYELMNELGVTDLYEPLQNVKVGVAILSQFFKENSEPHYVLMAYNGGVDYANRMLEAGKVSDYALEITERAYEYER